MEQEKTEVTALQLAEHILERFGEVARTQPDDLPETYTEAAREAWSMVSILQRKSNSAAHQQVADMWTMHASDHSWLGIEPTYLIVQETK